MLPEFKGNIWKMLHAQGNSMMERHLVVNATEQCKSSVKDSIRRYGIKTAVLYAWTTHFRHF